MAMEVYGTLVCDMDRFIEEHVCLFHNSRLGNHLSFFFAFNFLGSMLVLFLSMLKTYVRERKIALARNACSRPPIIIRSHDLHANNIKKVMGEITSYHHERINSLSSLVLVGFTIFELSLAFPFVLHVMVLTIFCDNRGGFRD
jgi:hypothetical protein